MKRSSSTNRFQPLTSVNSGDSFEVTPDLYCTTIQIVNVVFFGFAGDGKEWVLIDAGMPKSAQKIKEAAAKRFGKNNPPKAIILTHAHFDHIGGLIDLLEEWDVPVYAHGLELPYLRGAKDYPLPDFMTEGGMVAKLSLTFPVKSIDIGDRVRSLPTDKTVPFMEGWQWIHTPGHTEGHVSLFRETDRALIVGDAFVTVRQDSIYKVLVQELEMNGPPRYLTPDWIAAEETVKKLHALNPSLAITGHGIPVEGQWLSEELERLADKFKELAVPKYGKFVAD
jgi:glyoxylase-like metal-dependent hydrolase (beta-lactamase superfamily II)